jgi:hypothetical protein
VSLETGNFNREFTAELVITELENYFRFLDAALRGKSFVFGLSGSTDALVIAQHTRAGYVIAIVQMTYANINSSRIRCTLTTRTADGLLYSYQSNSESSQDTVRPITATLLLTQALYRIAVDPNTPPLPATEADLYNNAVTLSERFDAHSSAAAALIVRLYFAEHDFYRLVSRLLNGVARAFDTLPSDAVVNYLQKTLAPSIADDRDLVPPSGEISAGDVFVIAMSVLLSLHADRFNVEAGDDLNKRREEAFISANDAIATYEERFDEPELPLLGSLGKLPPTPPELAKAAAEAAASSASGSMSEDAPSHGAVFSV